MQETRSRWTALGCVAVGISEQGPALRKGIKVRRFTLRVPLHHTNPIIEVIYNYKNYIRLIRILRGRLYECDAAGNNRETGSPDHFRVFSRSNTLVKGSAVLFISCSHWSRRSLIPFATSG